MSKKAQFYLYISFAVLFVIGNVLVGQELKHEKDYQKLAAKEFSNSKIEHVLPDRTRIDILTDKQAIEVDWASKWAEGIGQSLHYSTMTGKEAGLILILKKPEDIRYVSRVKHILLIKSIKINLYTINSNGVLKKEN